MFRKILKFIVPVLIFINVFPSVYSQGIWYTTDSTIYKGDSVILHIEEFRGDIQWQRSFDLDVWDSIPGASYDSLKMVADTSSYFRAKVTEGNCNPIFSDTIHLNVVKLSNKSILINNVGASLLSDSTEQAQGTYKYEFGDSIPELDAGNVLVSDSGQGYMRIITNVTQAGGQYIVETEQARLVDVIDECNIQDSIKLLINSLKSAYVNGIPIPAKVIYLEKGVKLKSKGSGLDLTNMVLFSGTVEYENEYGVQEEADLDITITNGEVSFEPMFERNLKIRIAPPGVKYLKLTAGGNLEFDLDLEVVCNAPVNYSADKTILKVLFGPIPLVGVVPMFIELSFKVGFETGLDINGSVTAGFESDFALEFGAEYDRNEVPKWNSIWNKNSQFTVHEPVWDANANFGTKVYVAPELAATIASVAGPYMSVIPYLRFDAGVEIPNWDWELAGGIDGNLEFKVELFGYQIADWDTTLLNWETTLASNSGTFTEYPPIVETSEVSSITDSSALCGGNVIDEGGATVTERGVCFSTSEYPDITDNKEQIGSGSGIFSTSITGLQPTTTYYVRAYAINSEGTAYGSQVSFTTELEPHGLEWSQTFDGSNWDDDAYSVQQTADGGYILAGYTNPYEAGDKDGVWLIKTDAAGVGQWDQTFGGAEFDVAYSVRQTADGGYILAGCTGFYEHEDIIDAWLIKTDATGVEQWDQTFGGSGRDVIKSVQQTTDGGYILAGYTESYGAGNNDGWLIKTDAVGVEQWSKTFGGSSYDKAWSVQQTTDGGYILAGYTESYGAGNDDAWLIKTNAEGIEQWSQTFGGSGRDVIKSVQQTTDGGYILAGTIYLGEISNEDAWLIKTNATGIEQWSQTFGGSNWDWINSVQQTTDGGYILAGGTDSYGNETGREDAWLIKTDVAGTKQWSQTFGNFESDENSEFRSVQQTTDGSYILAGYTDQSYETSGSDAWLIKVSH